MEAVTTWYYLELSLQAGDLQGAARAACDLNALRMGGEPKPDCVPAAAWRVGALRDLARILVAVEAGLGAWPLERERHAGDGLADEIHGQVARLARRAR